MLSARQQMAGAGDSGSKNQTIVSKHKNDLDSPSKTSKKSTLVIHCSGKRQMKVEKDKTLARPSGCSPNRHIRLRALKVYEGENTRKSQKTPQRKDLSEDEEEAEENSDHEEGSYSQSAESEGTVEDLQIVEEESVTPEQL